MSEITEKMNFRIPPQYVNRMDASSSPLSDYRTEFMRDRDRVLYSTAFRRLAGKTQIYLTGQDDHRRNRLTHTLEVSQIARTIAFALDLDCDLAEAIALGHDIGHAPFGHAGEQILHEIMVPASKISIKNSPMRLSKKCQEYNKDLFGFKHNIQSVRVAASLEENDNKHGLNLTNYTLWGILHHSSLEYSGSKVKSDYQKPTYCKKFDEDMLIKGSQEHEAWSFEAFVVAEADEIAQWHHDLEDALRSGAMSIKSVCDVVKKALFDYMNEDDKRNFEELCKGKELHNSAIARLSQIVVNTLVTYTVNCTKENFKKLWDRFNLSDDEAREEFFKKSNLEKYISKAVGRTVFQENVFSANSDEDENTKKLNSIDQVYRHEISEKIHHSRDVERMNAKGRYIIKKLFQAYFTNPQQMPDSFIVRFMVEVGEYSNLEEAYLAGIGAVREKMHNLLFKRDELSIENEINLMRTICDHISGMTDRYAISEYKDLYE